MTSSAEKWLVGDIGGTNARFALAGAGQAGFDRLEEMRCADYESAELAIRHYLAAEKETSVKAICLAVAGPIVDQGVRFTNNHWSITADALASEFSDTDVRLLNDFEAIAYSIPILDETECVSVGSPESVIPTQGDYNIAILGPGTGLGAAGLIRRGEHFIPVVSEGSHIGFAPESQVQFDILSRLREKFDRVSVERLLSGPGIENIYWALSGICGDKDRQLSAREIFTAASDNSDARAAEAVQHFFEILGQVAGDLVLTLGANSGVVIAGGIVRRYPNLLAGSRFRNGFENKGRHRCLMERIPAYLILHPQPGILGASVFVRQMWDTPAGLEQTQ